MTEIFVFGSNLKGIHGRGAALFAKNNHGAIQGIGVGLQGTSYAIPTKQSPYVTLDLYEINFYVAQFLAFARNNPNFIFQVTPIGCGLAGFSPCDIAPMFHYAMNLKNVVLPPEFTELLSI